MYLRKFQVPAAFLTSYRIGAASFLRKSFRTLGKTLRHMLLMLGVSGATLAHADFDPAASFASYGSTYYLNAVVGFQFHTNSAISVNALGWALSADGGHEVGIWTTGGSLLTSAIVGPGDSQEGFFFWHSIAEITLAANQDYVIGGVTHYGPTAYFPSGITSDSRISFVQDRFMSGATSLTMPWYSNGYPSPIIWGPNFGIANPVPEPETYAMLLAGLGLLGFAARRRKLKETVAA